MRPSLIPKICSFVSRFNRWLLLPARVVLKSAEQLVNRAKTRSPQDFFALRRRQRHVVNDGVDEGGGSATVTAMGGGNAGLGARASLQRNPQYL